MCQVMGVHHFDPHMCDIFSVTHPFSGAQQISFDPHFDPLDPETQKTGKSYQVLLKNLVQRAESFTEVVGDAEFSIRSKTPLNKRIESIDTDMWLPDDTVLYELFVHTMWGPQDS